MIKAVIFDLDGTLIDTLADIAFAHNIGLRAFGLPARPVDDFRTIIGSGVIEAVQRAVPEGTDDETINALNRMYQEYYPEHCTERASAYPGAAECIRRLDAAGVVCAVITNKTELTALKTLKYYYPDTDFRFIWGNNGERPLKPAPDAGRAACEFLGLSPSEIAYVGDSDVDMLFAKASGFLPIGAAWGYRGREELERAGAGWIAAEAGEIVRIINN